MVPDPCFITRNGIFEGTNSLVIYQISVNVTAVNRIALQNCGVEWLVVRSKFQVFLVPNYRAFRITVIYVTYFGFSALLLVADPLR